MIVFENEKERDRLAELLANCHFVADSENYEQIADFLLANGVIFPPCKAGDMIYVKKDGKYEKTMVIRIDAYPNGKKIIIDDSYHTYDFDDLNRTFVVTEEEAERRARW